MYYITYNYILITQNWTGTKSRHHNDTHLEERSLVKKDAFWAKSSINFKSSSSIMSSGRASSSSSSSRFSAILEDDVYRLRSVFKFKNLTLPIPVRPFYTLLQPGVHQPSCMYFVLSQKLPLYCDIQWWLNRFLPSPSVRSCCQNGYTFYFS